MASTLASTSATLDKPLADPAAVDPTAIASTATADPIRPTGTDDLMAESRPETTGVAAASAAATTAPTKTSLPQGEASIDAQPINEGTLEVSCHP